MTEKRLYRYSAKRQNANQKILKAGKPAPCQIRFCQDKQINGLITHHRIAKEKEIRKRLALRQASFFQGEYDIFRFRASDSTSKAREKVLLYLIVASCNLEELSITHSVRPRRVVQSLSFPDRARQAHTLRM